MVQGISTSTNVQAAKASVNWTNKPENIALLKEWVALKQTEKAGEVAKAKRQALEAQRLRPALGEAREVIIRGVVALKESSQRENHSIDQDALAAGWPEAFAATRRTTPYTFFQVNLPANLK